MSAMLFASILLAIVVAGAWTAFALTPTSLPYEVRHVVSCQGSQDT